LNIQHPVLQYVHDHDYKAMFSDEIEKRKQFFYPPFSRLILLTFKHKLKEIVDDGARRFADALHTRYGKYIVGPAEPVVSRVRNQYLMEMLLKLPRDGKFISQCKHDLLEQVAVLRSEKRFRSIVVVADVDPI